MSVWDFFLVFGTMSQDTPDELTVKNFQGIYLSPQQAKALWNVLGHNLAQYEQTFGPSLSSSFPRPAAPSTNRVTNPGKVQRAQRPAARAPGDIPLWMLFPLFFAAVYLSHLTPPPPSLLLGRRRLLHPCRVGLLPHRHPDSADHRHQRPSPTAFHSACRLVAPLRIRRQRNPHAGLHGRRRRTAGRLSTSQDPRRTTAAAIATVLTALYPVWFAQSTLAHADIFAAAFTLWGLAFYFDAPRRRPQHGDRTRSSPPLMFSFAALSKETAIVTPPRSHSGKQSSPSAIRNSQRKPATTTPAWLAALLFTHPPARGLVRLPLPPHRLRLRQSRVPPLQRHRKPQRLPHRALPVASSPSPDDRT